MNSSVRTSISRRAARTAAFFGLQDRQGAFAGPFSGAADSLAIARGVGQRLCCGEIALITGASGSGKSTLLRSLSVCALCPPLSLADIRLPDRVVVDCFPRLPLTRTLALLGTFGLGEVWTYLRHTSALSEGERFRLRLALAFHAAQRVARRSQTGRTLLVIDEFASCLDRLTARVVARNFRRAITRRSRLSAVLATAHDDLQTALAPDHHLRCDFGQFQLQTAA